MNATLQESSTGTIYGWKGPFMAQLQLVRTLRPPSTFGTSSNTVISATPPPYQAATDSFLTGPLQLSNRPKVATIQINSKLKTPWDIYHNVSPVDVRGHFLLLPTISCEKNHRSQRLIADDCYDMLQLAKSIQPCGSLLLAFNSVGAGASQNHIHCHLWPSPPLATWNNHHFEDTSIIQTQDDDDDDDHEHYMPGDLDSPFTELASQMPPETSTPGWSWYAVSRVESIYDIMDLQVTPESPSVQVSYLEYPCFCILMSSTSLSSLGLALSTLLKSIGDAPHNVGLLNRPEHDDDNGSVEVVVDAFVFVRSKERSPNVTPATKMGSSEMMGVFHAQNQEQFNEMLQEIPMQDNTATSTKLAMIQALQDISHEEPWTLWETIQHELLKVFPASSSSLD